MLLFFERETTEGFRESETMSKEALASLTVLINKALTVAEMILKVRKGNLEGDDLEGDLLAFWRSFYLSEIHFLFFFFLFFFFFFLLEICRMKSIGPL